MAQEDLKEMVDEGSISEKDIEEVLQEVTEKKKPSELSFEDFKLAVKLINERAILYDDPETAKLVKSSAADDDDEIDHDEEIDTDDLAATPENDEDVKESAEDVEEELSPEEEMQFLQATYDELRGKVS